MLSVRLNSAENLPASIFPDSSTGHPWIAARDLKRVCDGTENLAVDGSELPFLWYAWWNGYALLVLLRRKPRLSVIGGLFSGVEKLA